MIQPTGVRVNRATSPHHQRASDTASARSTSGTRFGSKVSVTKNSHPTRPRNCAQARFSSSPRKVADVATTILFSLHVHTCTHQVVVARGRLAASVGRGGPAHGLLHHNHVVLRRYRRTRSE